MNKRVFVAMERNRFVVSNEDGTIKKLYFDEIEPINNVPFCHYLWDAD